MRSLPCLALLVSMVLTSIASAQSPIIDGIFDEWTPANQVATDPSGDNTGAFDVTTVSASSNGNVLYLHFDIGKVINLQNGDKADGTLQLKLSANERAIDIDFRKRIAADESGKRIGWNSLGYQCLPTYASDKYELRVDLSQLGVKPGDKISLQFAGSDSLVQPVQITLSEPTDQVGTAIDWQKPAGAFRVVNQNTLQNGLADSERQGKFQRLLAAVDADVCCFQEEWDQAKFLEGFVKTVPSNGKPIKYAWEGGCAIVTTLDLVGLPMKLDRAIAALVTTAEGKSVVVISAHFKCCGYAGSKEDDLRVQQAEQLVGEIKRMRQGAFGERAKNSPVVLIGDYNLVGSREPLDVINAAGLQDVICRTPDGSASTWRGLKPDSSFWPGRLDIVTTSGFRSVTGRIFNCSRMSASELEKVAVDPSDSAASDHLMLVVDCDVGR